jgi:hypothetical protein
MTIIALNFLSKWDHASKSNNQHSNSIINDNQNPWPSINDNNSDDEATGLSCKDTQ